MHSFHIRIYAETDGVLLPQVLVTFADFGYSVQALWFYCFQRLLNDVAFQYCGFESKFNCLALV